jgi:hypothetical protein
MRAGPDMVDVDSICEEDTLPDNLLANPTLVALIEPHTAPRCTGLVTESPLLLGFPVGLLALGHCEDAPYSCGTATLAVVGAVLV